MCKILSLIDIYNNRFSTQCCNIRVGRCVVRDKTSADLVIGLDILHNAKLIGDKENLFIENCQKGM